MRLDGLIPGGGALAFALPGVAVVAHHQWIDGREVHARLTLDGLHLDLRAPDGPWTAELTWRGWMVQCPAYHGASLAWADLHVAAGLPHKGYAVILPKRDGSQRRGRRQSITKRWVGGA